jgi:predicted nucleotidyltransferase
VAGVLSRSSRPFQRSPFVVVRAWMWSADREDSVGQADIDILVDGQEKGNEVWRQARYLQAVIPIVVGCTGL